ncbi:flagellar protein FliT [Paenibacillus xylanexedens]|uniref:flagellar protein FliT n=1 Tax=Paenibacillus xylanexedens TaxID=528191 RepID=UPI0011A8C92F|nr:flagellar protein FliT [Paenibacillus xylanexedens]
MDERIDELEALTHQMVVRINQVSSEELTEFVDRRQALVDSILHTIELTPLTPEQQQRLRTVLEQDSILLGRMTSLKDEAGSWLKNHGQAKMQRNAYEAGYTPDSFLMDKKK